MEFQQPRVICFFDYKRAFDSIDQTNLWKTLYNFTNIDPSYINLLAKIYENAKSKEEQTLAQKILFGFWNV